MTDKKTDIICTMTINVVNRDGPHVLFAESIYRVCILGEFCEKWWRETERKFGR